MHVISEQQIQTLYIFLFLELTHYDAETGKAILSKDTALAVAVKLHDQGADVIYCSCFVNQGHSQQAKGERGGRRLTEDEPQNFLNS